MKRFVQFYKLEYQIDAYGVLRTDMWRRPMYNAVEHTCAINGNAITIQAGGGDYFDVTQISKSGAGAYAQRNTLYTIGKEWNGDSADVEFIVLHMCPMRNEMAVVELDFDYARITSTINDTNDMIEHIMWGGNNHNKVERGIVFDTPEMLSKNLDSRFRRFLLEWNIDLDNTPSAFIPVPNNLEEYALFESAWDILLKDA